MILHERPTLWIVAGPNGVGKTTYAFRHIRAVTGTTRFVNLDEIARGISPLDPSVEQRRAARVALDMMRELVAERVSFTIETTLSGRTHLALVDDARAAGFRVVLLYFIVKSMDVCRARIARRVSEGGHAVPDEDLIRRFPRSQRNFSDYAGRVDLWRVFDNNGPTPTTVAEGRAGCRSMMADLSGLPEQLADRLASMPPCGEDLAD